LTAGYYRTWYTNISVTDNLSVTPADFNQYCVTAPIDSRLPGGGGYQLCGLYDVTATKFGQVNNLIEQSSVVGGRRQVFNGVDVLLSARLGGGKLLNAGFSTGQTVVDNCPTPDVPTTPFCKTTNPWKGQTDIKVSAVYPLPWWGIATSATYQNLPGRDQTATVSVPNSQIAPALGRNLSSCPTPTGACAASVTVPLVAPTTLFEPRGNQLDIRLTKVFSVQRYRLRANFDVYNLANAGDVLSEVTAFGSAWLRPISIMSGRLIKIGAQLDF
jgi:hypothetical protein